MKSLVSQLKEALEEDGKKQAHDTFFNALFKAIEPYEQKFQEMIIAIWQEQERIIVANLKKLKKAWLRKDIFDDVSYPSGMYEKKVADEAEKLIIEILKEEGERTVAQYDFDIVFDIDDTEIQKWLKTYVPKFSKNLEEVNIAKLRKALIEGIEAGEGIPALIKRVNETYANWYKYRSENIARSEVIRASNKAALEACRQIVTGKRLSQFRYIHLF